MEQNIKSIASAAVDIDAFYNDLPQIIAEERENNPIWEHLYNLWGENQKGMFFRISEHSYRILYNRLSFFSDKETEITRSVERAREFLDAIKTFIRISGSSFRCLYTDDVFALVTHGGQESAMLIPAAYIQVIPYRNYDNLTASERQAMLSEGSFQMGNKASVACGGTVNSVNKSLDRLMGQLQSVQDTMEAVKNADVPELVDLKNEIAAKKAELEEKINNLLADLEAKKAELQQKQSELELQVYRLSCEIYSIRCYTGECVNFSKIRDGLPAPVNTPLVLLQKMRYMDEELGRLASLYDVDFGDIQYMEELLKYNDAAFEVFCPNRRCVTLVRVSRENKRYSISEKYANMLETTEKYLGKSIAIIIRDGERLYISWTDESYISFSDDFFFRPGISEEAGDTERQRYESDDAFEKRMKQKRMQQVNEAVGRSFVFSVLQGVIDRKIIEFPDGMQISVKRPSDYVVRSYADAWITDERYGSFDKMMQRCNKNVQTGDYILTMQYLRPERREYGLGWRDERWHNDRGIGDRNRTHDVSARDCTIYRLNKTQLTATYTIRYVAEDGSTHESRYDERTKEEISKLLERNYWKNPTVVDVENEETHYYISLEKQESLSGKARANFEVFPHEYLNLGCMNSVWLEYVIQTQKTGVIRVGGEQISFSHLLPYLKTALDFVRKREEEELSLLTPFIPNLADDTEWPVKLSEWKLQYNVHTMTPFQAKRYAKYRIGQEELKGENNE